MHLEQLIERVESSADWRAGKADQYPDDNRNVRSSQALIKLAKRLRALPRGDKNRAAYEAVMNRLMESDNDSVGIDAFEHES